MVMVEVTTMVGLRDRHLPTRVRNTRPRSAEGIAKEMTVKGEKRKDLEVEIVELDGLKRKKYHLEQDIQALLSEADEKAEVAENTGDMTLVAKSNALRRSAKDKVAALQAVVEKMTKAVETGNT